MLKNREPALTLVTLFVVAVYGVSLSSHKPIYDKKISSPDQSASQIIPPESPEDRIADYTEVLAWFTGLLALVSATQIAFLIKADKTARIAADAAKKSADAAETAFNKLERPYLFISNARNFERDSTGIAYIEYEVANYGKTTAIIDNVRAVISSGVEPDTPIRVYDQHDLFVCRVVDRLDIYHPTEDAPDGIDFKTSDGEVVPQLKDGEDVFLWVIVSYRGAFTEGHETSACWRYDGLTNRLVQWGHDDYNYVR